MRVYWISISIQTLVLAAVAVVAMPGLLQSQAPQPAAAPSIPVVTFTFDFPNSNPQHYSISVDENGHAKYECRGKVAADFEEQEYQAEFQISPLNREHIFEWTRQTQYFSGKIDSGSSKLAFTGAKILSYRDGARSNAAHFNYSNLEPVRQLTTLFQNMASTLEYVWRMAYYHRYQKLALDEELKRMEAQARGDELSELQSVTPVLREIVDDTSVINVVRARAQELIEMGQSAGNARGRGPAH